MKNVSLGEGLFFLFIVFPLGILLSGWTITVLWDWFVVTTFKLAPLTIAQGLGLSLVLGYFTHQSQYNKEQTAGEVFAQCFTKPLVFLALGWIIHLFI
jgi:hypothetical protein